MNKNQRLGYTKYQKKFTYPDSFSRKIQISNKRPLQEISVRDAIDTLYSLDLIVRVHSIIGGGKEATVLLAETDTGDLVCAKVFRYFTGTIKKRLQGTKHLLPMDMAMLAAKQEYWNLVEMESADIPVPHPIFLRSNIFLMEFISDNSSLHPAHLLKDVDLSVYEAEEFLYSSIDILADLFLKAFFVHGDYSAHNLLFSEGRGLVVIDVSQSVQYNRKTFTETPIRIRLDYALDIFKSDLHNINNFFKRNYCLSVDLDDVCDRVIAKLPSNLRSFLETRSQDIYPAGLMPIDSLRAKEQFRSQTVTRRSSFRRQKPKSRF